MHLICFQIRTLTNYTYLFSLTTLFHFPLFIESLTILGFPSFHLFYYQIIQIFKLRSSTACWFEPKFSNLAVSLLRMHLICSVFSTPYLWFYWCHSPFCLSFPFLPLCLSVCSSSSNAGQHTAHLCKHSWAPSSPRQLNPHTSTHTDFSIV
jgi:hypothetical protein